MPTDREYFVRTMPKLRNIHPRWRIWGWMCALRAGRGILGLVRTHDTFMCGCIADAGAARAPTHQTCVAHACATAAHQRGRDMGDVDARGLRDCIVRAVDRLRRANGAGETRRQLAGLMTGRPRGRLQMEMEEKAGGEADRSARLAGPIAGSLAVFTRAGAGMHAYACRARETCRKYPLERMLS